VTLTFSLLILTAGIAAFLGGLWLRRSGPRRVTVCAGLLCGAGVSLASLLEDRLLALYLTYGLIAGVGLGLGYIVPIATLFKLVSRPPWLIDLLARRIDQAIRQADGGER
jgi:MFS transporter, OFA family, oxalate/formate antiporter